MTEDGRRLLEALLKTVQALRVVKPVFLGGFKVVGEDYFIPRFSFSGSVSTDPIRIGILGAIHGDEPAGALAIARFPENMGQEPALAEGCKMPASPG